MKKLFLVEKASRDLVDFIKGQSESFLLLTTPESIEAFDGQGLNTFLPEDFVTAEELNSIGMRNYPRVREFVSEIDTELYRKFPILQIHGLRPAYYHMDRFKIIMDSVTSKLFILTRAVERLNPQELYCEKPLAKEDLGAFFVEIKSLYGLLARVISGYYGIRNNNYPFTFRETGAKKRMFLLRMASVLKKAHRLANLKVQLPRTGPRMLSFNADYDQARILKKGNLSKDFEVWRWRYSDKTVSGPDLTKRENLNFSVPKAKFGWDERDPENLMKRLANFCIDREISWFGVIESRVLFFLKELIPHYFGFYLTFKNMLGRIKPDIILSNTGVANIAEGVVQKAISEKGIPLVMIQHGGGGYGLLNLPAISVRDFEEVPNSYYLMWGEGIKKYFRNDAAKYNVSIYPVGSSIVREIFNRSRRAKNKPRIKNIFYVIQNYRSLIYYPGGSGHYTNTWYFNFHKKMIEVFKRFSEYKIVIKLPAKFKEPRLYHRLIEGSDHIRLAEAPLLQLIDKADLFIIDSLSTSIVQCAATTKPIVVYTGEYCRKPNPEALISLKKRAVICETEKKYLERVEAILKNPEKYDADPNNREFIDLYGIGKSASEPDWPFILKNIIQKHYSGKEEVSVKETQDAGSSK